MDIQRLKNLFDEANIKYLTNEPLAQYTTWKIGGPADIFIKLQDSQILPKVLSLAKSTATPVTFLGGGSNVLINDTGIRGLVIHNELSGIIINSQNSVSNSDSLKEQKIFEPAATSHLIQVDTNEYYDFTQLDYDESSLPKVEVTIESGTYLSYTINYLLTQGITGLQWYAGIPGTIGGAVFNDIHGGSHLLDEYLIAVEIVDADGSRQLLPRSEITMHYDFSSLQNRYCFISKVIFALPQGDKIRAQKTAYAWALAKKEKQPYNSAGCCFRNISEQDRIARNLITNSWGYIIDKQLNLKGYTVGGASISNLHAAFIVNNGNASAHDVISILNHVYSESAAKLNGLTPKAEIFFLGFTAAEISKYK